LKTTFPFSKVCAVLAWKNALLSGWCTQ
jgi:hypothetical protein